jgi:hypothetical protein
MKLAKTNAQEISIYRDDVWAVTGIIEDGVIRDCSAVLGDDQDASDKTYESIEDAISDGTESATRPDGEYTWSIK